MIYLSETTVLCVKIIDPARSPIIDHQGGDMSLALFFLFEVLPIPKFLWPIIRTSTVTLPPDIWHYGSYMSFFLHHDSERAFKIRDRFLPKIFTDMCILPPKRPFQDFFST